MRVCCVVRRELLWLVSVVTVASMAHRVLPVSNVQRYSQAEKKIVMVPRPLATGEYNKYMCGTDRTVPYLC